MIERHPERACLGEAGGLRDGGGAHAPGVGEVLVVARHELEVDRGVHVEAIDARPRGRAPRELSREELKQIAQAHPLGRLCWHFVAAIMSA